MAAPDFSWNDITAEQTNADSIIDEVLTEGFRQNLIHLEQWLGDSYTAAKDHNHDNVNSANVALGDRTVAGVKLITNDVSLEEIKKAITYTVSYGTINAGVTAYGTLGNGGAHRFYIASLYFDSGTNARIEYSLVHRDIAGTRTYAIKMHNPSGVNAVGVKYKVIELAET